MEVKFCISCDVDIKKLLEEYPDMVLDYDMDDNMQE